MRSALLLAAAAVADDAPDWLPASLRRLGPVTRSERHWQELKNFFRPGGPSENFRIAVDASCVDRVTIGSASRIVVLRLLTRGGRRW